MWGRIFSFTHPNLHTAMYTTLRRLHKISQPLIQHARHQPAVGHRVTSQTYQAARTLYEPHNDWYRPELHHQGCPSAVQAVDESSADGSYTINFSHDISTITAVQVVEPSQEGALLAVQWGDTRIGPRGVSHFPLSWLRDNCLCPGCFHPFTKARLTLMADFNIETQPIHTEVTDAGQSVRVTWEDGHVSQYDVPWLWSHRFDVTAQTDRRRTIHRTPLLWGSEMQRDVRRHDFQKILTDESSLYAMLCDLEDFGFLMLHNASQEKGQLKRFAEHISFERTTHYGRYFQVTAKASPSNLAYTAGNLGLHTDIPYDRYPPGVQMIHYIRQTPMVGGLSQFADGFQAAAVLRDEDPQAFEVLTSSPVDYIDVGVDAFGQFSKLCPHNTITLDCEGRVDSVYFSNQCRDSHIRLPASRVHSLLVALKKFNAILYRFEHIVELKPQPGDVSVFYNNRVLHGRTAYEMRADGDRYLEGVYMDIDELTSRRRLIAERLGLE